MTVEETCRLCQNNLMAKGVKTNSRNLFSVKHKGKLLHQRFRDVGVIFQKRPGVYSCRICVKCYRKFVKVEEALRILKIWQVYQQTTETQRAKELDLQTATQPRLPPSHHLYERSRNPPDNSINHTSDYHSFMSCYVT